MASISVGRRLLPSGVVRSEVFQVEFRVQLQYGTETAVIQTGEAAVIQTGEAASGKGCSDRLGLTGLLQLLSLVRCLSGSSFCLVDFDFAPLIPLPHRGELLRLTSGG